MVDKNFKASDGWLFATLKCLKKGKLNLYSILSIGDILNHSIFTLDEINDGLSRLESMEFVQIVDDKFYFTDKAKRFIRFNKKQFEPIIAEQVRYSNLFQKMIITKDIKYMQYFSNNDYEIAKTKYI